MRSATSYFNPTLYRKTLARFWPLWGGYGVIWLFALPLYLLNTYISIDRNWNEIQWQKLDRALNLPHMLGFGLFLAVVFAILSAMAVFGYLYNSRSACWTHALPLRREALFTTQYLAGLSFLILPLLASGVLAAIVEVSFLPMEDWGRALAALLILLLAQSGLCLFFFSFAAFCAMFTGHILALPAFYGILNGLAAGIYYLMTGLMREFFYGYVWDETAYEIVRYLTPVAALDNARTWYYGSVESNGYLDSPGLLAAYAAVGVVLALASLYVYRRRHVETAGDVIAIPLVKPLFKYGVSFCSGLAFGVLTCAFFGWGEVVILIPCILIWSVVGYFVAEMLLRKSFRVLKAWKGAAATAAVLLALCLVCFLDVFGVVKRVPDLSQVESVYVDLSLSVPYDDARYLRAAITDPQQIETICSLHQAVVANPDRDWTSYGEGYFYFELTYSLKGGGQLSRDYRSVPVSEDGTDGLSQIYQSILEDRDLMYQAYGFDTFLENSRLSGAYLDYVVKEDDSSTIYLEGFEKQLWDAVQEDFAEGTIGVRYVDEYGQTFRENTYRTDLVFEATPIQDGSAAAGYADGSGSYSIEVKPTYSSNLTITLTPQARHTLAVLEQTGIYEKGWALSTYDGYGYNPQFPDTESW